MKAVVAAFNQEKALVGAFSVITNLRMELFETLIVTIMQPSVTSLCRPCAELQQAGRGSQDELLHDHGAGAEQPLPAAPPPGAQQPERGGEQAAGHHPGPGLHQAARHQEELQRHHLHRSAI